MARVSPFFLLVAGGLSMPGCGPTSTGDPTTGDPSNGDSEGGGDTGDSDGGGDTACQEGEKINFNGICCRTLPAVDCKYSCSINVGASTHDCSGSVSITSLAGTAGTAVIDMSSYESLTLLVNVCDATGWVLHVADSPSCDGYGGDSSDFENDAELYLVSRSLQMRSNQLAPTPYAELLNQDFVPAAGCVARAITLEDQLVRSFHPCVDLASEHALRINPPIDAEGPPDALWHLGMNRTFGSASRTGQGLQSLTLCFRQ